MSLAARLPARGYPIIGNQEFRVIAECVGSVKAVKLSTNVHPPTRLVLSYWYNPLREGMQRIIENILFVDESCATKRPLKVYYWIFLTFVWIFVDDEYCSTTLL